MGNKNSTEKLLYKTDFSDVPFFSFENIITKAKVVDVYDGDTITIVFYHNDIPIKDHFRMYGYDSPEMKPLLSLPNRTEHIEYAKRAKEKLSELVLNKIVWIKFMKKEKYGRLMGVVYNDSKKFIDNYENSINKFMVDNKFGKEYYGGKK